MIGRPSLRSAALVVGAWTGLHLLWLAPRLVRHVLWDSPLAWSTVAASLLYAWFWAALTPVVFAVARSFPLTAGTWRRSLPVHVVALLGVVMVDRAFMAGLDEVINHLPWPDLDALSYPGKVYWLTVRAFGIVVALYCTVVGIHHALHFHRASRERALRAAQLEGELARTRLQVLRIQLQPRFLFETLRSIAGRAGADPIGADRMISRLSDFLRLTLERGTRAEVSLREELEFLDAYLEVEALRVGDATRIRKRIAPEVLDARVPNLILQPLVATAASGPGGSAVDVAAQRLNGTLVVEVGRGAAETPDGARPMSAGEAEALAATRERLRELYGAEHRLELRGEPGRLRVWLEIPFRQDDDDTEGPR